MANLTTFGSKETWMEPMNKFLISHRSEFKEFVDSVCSVSSERPAQVVNPSYATPIQILGRLPPTSREGFPSLPFLIDNARSFALLVRLWLDNAPPGLADIPDLDENILKFHAQCLATEHRTKECLNKAEQAERPNYSLEVKWEELVEQIEKSGSLGEENSSKANTPAAENPISSTSASVNSNRNSFGYFPRPPLLHRSTDPSFSDEAEDDTPSSAASTTWDQGRPLFRQPKYTESRKSVESSHNSSTVSLENSEASKRQSSMPRDTAGKYRLLDFVAGSRRRGKDKEKDKDKEKEKDKTKDKNRDAPQAPVPPPPAPPASDLGPRNEFI